MATGASASVPSGPATRCGKRLISHPGAWFPSWKADGREGHRVRPCPTRAARPRAQGKSVDVSGKEDGGPLGCAPSRLCSVRPPCVAASAESPRGLGWVSPSGRQNREGDGTAEAWGALPVLRVVRSLALDAGCSHGGGGQQGRLEMGTPRPFGALWGLQMRKGGSARSADSTGDSGSARPPCRSLSRPCGMCAKPSEDTKPFATPSWSTSCGRGFET